MQISNPNTRRSGVLLVTISAVVFSTAGIFAKGVPTEAWDIIFWRGLAASAFTLLYLAVTGALRAEIQAFGKPALVLIFMMAAGSAAFIPAFKFSTVANVALIYGSAPFLAALLSWLFISEPPTRRILVASCCAFGGVLVIVGGSLGGGGVRGDVLALFMTLMMAGTMVIYRRFPQTTAALPAALSSVVLLGPAWYWGAPFAVPMSELPVLMAFGLVFAVASVTLSEGARRLPAAETALLSIMEMPLAPLFALIILGAMPSIQTLLGGAVIMGAVIWSQRPAGIHLRQS